MNQDFKVGIVGIREKIDLSHLKNYITQLKPTECYIKPDGSVDNESSLCFVLKDALGGQYVAQISVKMFQPVLDALKNL